MLLHEEFAALIRTLESERVGYAVAGALAVAVWGAPRATTDIDLLICRKDVARALLVARGLGFDIVADPMTFQDGTEMCRATKFEGGDQLTLDLLLTDEDAPHWTSRERHPFGDGVVTVVSRDSLIQMKDPVPAAGGGRARRASARGLSSAQGASSQRTEASNRAQPSRLSEGKVSASANQPTRRAGTGPKAPRAPLSMPKMATSPSSPGREAMTMAAGTGSVVPNALGKRTTATVPRRPSASGWSGSGSAGRSDCR